MTRFAYLMLALLGLWVVGTAAAFQNVPGYMDAEYYFAGGLRLFQGHGFTELILWNYLDDPTGLPHPSHAYWMPLTSILAAVGMKLFNDSSFTATRSGFIVLAMMIPPMTAWLSIRVTRSRPASISAGVLAAFSAFYVPYLPTTDAFGLYMFGGTLFICLAGTEWHTLPKAVLAFGRVKVSHNWAGVALAMLIGMVSGVMYLTRADGVLWLLLALFIVPWMQKEICTRLSLPMLQGLGWAFASVIACLVGYLAVAGPWLWRNLGAFGAPIAPGGTHMLWLTSYNDLFIYPASLLTPERWWQMGLLSALQARLWAAGQNLQTFFAVQGEVFLVPLVLLGLWRHRRQRLVGVGVLAWLFTFVLMTFVFPYAGARGGFFHSGAAFQPFFWAVAPEGLEVLITWGNRIRGWNIPQARKVFHIGMLALALLLTCLIFWIRVIGDDRSPEQSQYAWNREAGRYARLEKALVERGTASTDIVMVNDSPGYFVASGRPSLSIPYGDLAMVQQVARRYQARYLLLPFNQLTGNDNLYDRPGDRAGLRYLGSVDETRIYEFMGP